MADDFSIGKDAPPARASGKAGFALALVSMMADYLWAGNGYAGAGAPDPRSEAVRDTKSTAMTAATKTLVGTRSDDFRKAVVRCLYDAGRMIIPSGKSWEGAVFSASIDGTPDGFDGLTVRGTALYDKGNDTGPYRFGVWIGTPDPRAGTKSGSPTSSVSPPATTPDADADDTPDADDTGDDDGTPDADDDADA
jgi:hypothetical protein